MQEILRLENVSVHFGGVRALSHVNITFHEGQIVLLMGPNGAGKSTLLKVIFGLIPINTGRVFWQGNEVVSTPYSSVRRGITFLPQGKRVFPHLTVKENLEMGGHLIKSKAELDRSIEQMFDLFPMLQSKRLAKSGELSGGMQQMLAIARGLMTEPKILLLDEPSLGLAPQIVHEVFEKVLEINQSLKTTIIVVEHNLKSVLEMASHVYLFNMGEVSSHGTGPEVLRNHIVIT